MPFWPRGRKGFSLAQGKRIGFIGAGRVGGALAATLQECGYAVVAVASRTLESAGALAGQLPGCLAVDPQAVVAASDIVFITTPDAAVKQVCESLTWRSGIGVVHTSGSLSRDVLAAAADAGAETGCLHPLQTFADHAQARMNVPGSFFAIEGEGWLRDELLWMVNALKGTPVELQADQKALYHAAASLASTYVVTLMSMASDLWAAFGQERGLAVRALLPLLQGSVNNIDALGVPLALTGPIARGEVETVERHLRALRHSAPALLPAYREMALQTIPVALARGGLTDSAAEALRRVLGDRGEAAPSRGNGRLERTNA